MLKPTFCVVLLWATANIARAGPAGSPEVPRDPTTVRQARQSLYADWRACRTQAYPDDVEKGAEKMSSTVEFRRAGKRTRAVVTIGVHMLDGTPVKASPLQASFIKCVKTRFEARTFFSGSRSQHGNRWGLANPFPGPRVVERGELGQQAAVAYILQQLAVARRKCAVKPALRGFKITVDTSADGSVGAIAITGAPEAERKCMVAQLAKILRFPVTSKASKVSVID